MKKDADARPSPVGRLYVAGGHAMLVGCPVHNPPHAHYNASILLATGKPFRFGHDGRWVTSNGLLVAPCVTQQLRTADDRVIIMQVDPDRDSYRRFGQRLHGRPWVEMSPGEHADMVAALPADDWSPGRAVGFFQRAVDVLAASAPGPLRRDPRVEKVRKLLIRNLEQPPGVDRLARVAALSVSRLQHLFKQELGLSLSQYLLWLPVSRAVLMLERGISLTEAALMAGFSDSAHFSRTFRRMFGLRPSAVLKDSSSVQVIILPDAPR